MYIPRSKVSQKAKTNGSDSTKSSSLGKAKAKEPEIEEYIANRDYLGASAILNFHLKSEDPRASSSSSSSENLQLLLWLAYCSFHLYEYQEALEIYETILASTDIPDLYLYRGCCLYYLQQYKEAMKEVLKGPSNTLQNRILFHCAHKLNDEDKLLVYHQQLTDSKEDQLSLAAIHYLRHHYQEATDIYKRLLLENRDDLALNVYIAMCYYKLDYYDVSLEILQTYLQAMNDSLTAVNLKACNQYKLYNGTIAKDEYKKVESSKMNVLLQHNLVVFEAGQNALRLLPSMIDRLPEARLNLVIYYLNHKKIQEAFDLIKDIEPNTSSEYILKGIVHAMLGQEINSRQYLKVAQQYFQLVGASATECDTIPGRQCMASCFFLLKQFEDVNIYLNSIQQYLSNDDDFCWNYGIALCATGHYYEGLELFLRIAKEDYRNEIQYLSWLCRAYISTKQSSLAWEIYLKLDNTDESFNLLQLIANDTYKMGEFLYSAKAFDILERLDPDPEYWEGKRGACIGVFQKVIAGQLASSEINEVINLLKTNNSSNNPQIEYIVRIMKKWCMENGVILT